MANAVKEGVVIVDNNNNDGKQIAFAFKEGERRESRISNGWMRIVILVTSILQDLRLPPLPFFEK